MSGTSETYVQNFGFSTKYRDAESGLIYYGYRWYDPESMRWISRDPLGEGGGINLHRFVANNPIVFLDALGENPLVLVPVFSPGGTAAIAIGLGFGATAVIVDQTITAMAQYGKNNIRETGGGGKRTTQEKANKKRQNRQMNDQKPPPKSGKQKRKELKEKRQKKNACN